MSTSLRRRFPPQTRRGRLMLAALAAGSILVIGVIVLGIQALVVRQELTSVMPRMSQLQEQILAGDTEAAAATAEEISGATGTALAATGGPVWWVAELLPVVGNDLSAVRTAARAADDLVKGGLVPLSGLDVKALGPSDGAINVEALASMAQPVADAAEAAELAQTRMATVNEAALLGPVRSAVKQFTDALDAYVPMLASAGDALGVLPDALGASGPRHYLVLMQNNAEARSNGGNPGVVMLLRADAGRLEIVRQVPATKFNNAREESILPLSQATAALHSDRVGKFIQDSTMPVDFRETGEVARAFWKESFGEDVDGVIGVDTITLSYLLESTGPMAVPGGELRPENVASELLNGVYFRYPLQVHQDAFFATVASNAFGALTGSGTDSSDLIKRLGRAVSEGRVLYTSAHAAEQRLVDGTRLSGPLPETSNAKTTAVGVFVNDNTEGKLDYYADLALSASSDMCTVSGAPRFNVEARYEYTLQPEQVAGLPGYISTGKYYDRGVKSTNLVFYGPVGAEFVSATLDGQPYVPHAGVVDHGRPAVRILFENAPATSHTVEVVFEGGEGEAYGPLEVRHTPLIRQVPVDVSTPGCAE